MNLNALPRFGRAAHLFLSVLIAGLATLSLPGLAPFISEFLVLIGTFTRYPALAVIASSALVLSAIYVLCLAATVVVWSLLVVLVSIFVRGHRLYWFTMVWLRMAIWGARVICGVRHRIQGWENKRGRPKTKTLSPGNRTTPYD